MPPSGSSRTCPPNLLDCAAGSFFGAVNRFNRTAKSSDRTAGPFSREARFRATVKLIKSNPNYNEAMEEALGIEGAQQTGPNLTTIQPEIEAEVSGNTVNVGWGWGGNSAFLDMIRLEVDRKGFTFLATDTTPDYTDTAPFPAAPTKWTYRAIYMVGDQQVGQWSKPVSVTVGG